MSIGIIRSLCLFDSLILFVACSFLFLRSRLLKVTLWYFLEWKASVKLYSIFNVSLMLFSEDLSLNCKSELVIVMLYAFELSYLALLYSAQSLNSSELILVGSHAVFPI